MEGHGSHWGHALATDAVGGTLGEFISHLGSANLAFTLIRSALFTNPGRIDEVFDRIHCFGHKSSKSTNPSVRFGGEGGVLEYWREKAVVCEDCTSFLGELLSSSWRHCGPELSKRYNQHRDQLPRSLHVNYDSVAIMTNLFKYMSMAYERLEKETKIALQTETHSSAFEESCREFFSENFDATNDTARLEALLTSLHETNINLLLARLYGGHHIEDTIQRDKEAFSRLIIPKDDLTYSFLEEADSQTEEQVAHNPPKGKNHDQNKKKLERKKKRRLAARAEKSEVEATEGPLDLLKETVATASNSVDKHGHTILEDNETTHISQGTTVFEDAHPVSSDASNERADEPSMRNDTVNSPTAVEEPVKGHLAFANLSEANSLPPTPPVIPDLIEQPISDVILEDLRGREAAHQYQEHPQASLEAEDNHEWTQVVGSRKKSNKKNSSGSNSTLTNTSAFRGNRHFFRGASRLQSSETLTKSLETAKNPIHQAKSSLPLRNQRTFASAASKSTTPNLSESNKSVPASTVPKPYTPKKASTLATVIPTVTEKTNTVSTTTGKKQGPWPLQWPARVPTVVEQEVARPGFGHHSKASDTESQPLPTTSTGAVKNQVSRSRAISDRSQVGTPSTATEPATNSTEPIASKDHSKTTTSANSADLRAITPIATIGHIADSQRNPRGPARPLLNEVIDPGPVPHYQHLAPFKKVNKMSDTTQATMSASIAPNADTLSLVESLRDAGVKDGAMSSLVPRLAELIALPSRPRLSGIGGSRLRPFAGRNLDVKRANKAAQSAGNSPLPPKLAREPFYRYPPPDTLTPENQEILDLINKGPPYKKYPRVPNVVDQEVIQPLAADFVTTKPAITTYDGKDTYEALGDRCPAPLTLRDHPSANKCIQSGKMFQCTYCRVEIPGDADAEKGIICPGCGPCSETRYCQRSHLLADSISHSEVCGQKTGAYPLMWSELPLHYQSLYPYIKPLTGSMTAQCFRQMAHCLIINSDGIIENPLKAHFEVQMTMEEKVRVYNYVQQMYQFQDQGQYYLFYPGSLAAGVEISFSIAMNDGSSGCYREDQRFARVRNAAFLTHHPTLLCVIYRRVKAAIKSFAKTQDKFHKIMQTFYSQFHEEFPALNLNTIAPLDKDYCFENDWRHIRNLVHDLERGNPILRAWITEDAEDDGIPTDPTARFEGKYWNFVHGPTFRAGSADRKDWGAGWFGQDEKIWQKQLDRKYLKLVTDELAQLETELEGEII